MADVEKISSPEFVKRDGIIADADYIQWLADVKKRFRESQARATVKVNTEMLEFYWSIGRDLVALRAESRWGAGVVKQFALDMRPGFYRLLVLQCEIHEAMVLVLLRPNCKKPPSRWAIGGSGKKPAGC